MPYHLDNEFLLDNPWITVVGCGGTGGFVCRTSAIMGHIWEVENPRV